MKTGTEPSLLLKICNEIQVREHLLSARDGSEVKPLPAMRDTRVRSLGWENPLEKEMATHSGTLAWKILWTEDPGRL